MKHLLILVLCCTLSISSIFAQRTFTEIESAEGIKTIEFTTQFAQVNVQTWDKNSIQIEAYIDIHDNTANDGFKWKAKREKETFIFESTTDFPGYIYAKGNKNDCCQQQTTDIRLTIFIPKDRILKMFSTYGSLDLSGIESTVYIKNTYGSIDIKFSKLSNEQQHLEATYSHLDIALPKTAKADFTLKTPYGEVLTELPLEVKANGNIKRNDSTIVARLNGGGTPIYAEANYNKIYLRYL